MLIFPPAFQDLLRALSTPCVPLPWHGCSRHPTCVPKHSPDPWYDHHCGTWAILSQEEADTVFGRQSLGFERPLGNRCSTRGRHTHNTQRRRDHRVWSADWVMSKELARYRRAYECLKNNSERVLFEKCFIFSVKCWLVSKELARNRRAWIHNYRKSMSETVKSNGNLTWNYMEIELKLHGTWIWNCIEINV